MIILMWQSTYRKKIKELETLHRISLETNKMITEKKNIEIENLEKLHDAKAKAYKCLIDYKNEEFEKIENENSKLYTKMIVNNRNLDNCFNINKRITKELEEANLKIAKLEKKNTSLVKRNMALEKLFKKYKNMSIMVHKVNVNVIRKLWCNKEAQRQLRRLADDETINNVHTVKKYVYDLAKLIGI